MVRIVLDLHDEIYAAFVLARQAPVTNVRVMEDGIQLAQVTARKPYVYTVPNNGSEHVFFSTSPRNERDWTTTITGTLPRQLGAPLRK
jgi:hypothetical protein